MKYKYLLLILLFPFVLSSCGGDNAKFPRHRYDTLKEVKENIGFSVLMPAFLTQFDQKLYEIKYYEAANPTVPTGYSVTVHYTGNEVKDYRDIEFRGINMNRAREDNEGFNLEYYDCVMNELKTVAHNKTIRYSAYCDRNYSSQDIAAQKGLQSNSELNQSGLSQFERGTKAQYFYCYFMDKNIRYSITFSKLECGLTNDQIVTTCLKDAEYYFDKY